jgi:hypothetical protein
MLPLKNLGLIEPEEERRQWVFHVMVSDRYTAWREAQAVPAEQPDAQVVAGEQKDQDATPLVQEISSPQR